MTVGWMIAKIPLPVKGYRQANLAENRWSMGKAVKECQAALEVASGRFSKVRTLTLRMPPLGEVVF